MKYVLSLFDGISVGRLALERAGIAFERYYASEIDPSAMKVSMKNFPDTVQLGDVTKWREWEIDWFDVDLLIGGSPCQSFSQAGNGYGFEDPRGQLFFEYAAILKHIQSVNPKVKFLLENVRMKQWCSDVISHHLGVQPVFVDSALVSAQTRKRLYWANWTFPQPKEQRIVLRDVLDGLPPVVVRWVNPVCVNSKSGRGGVDGLQPSLQDRIYSVNGPMPAVTASRNPQIIYPDPCGKTVVENNYALVNGAPHRLSVPEGHYTIRKLTPSENERLQTLPEGYTEGLSESKRVEVLGNGWTMEVIKHIFSYLT